MSVTSLNILDPRYSLEVITIYVHFQSKPLMNLKIFFATVHSLMNDTNLIDSSAAKLTCLDITHSPEVTRAGHHSFARSDTDVVIDSEPHLSGTFKTSLLFAPLAVCVHTGCSAFQFYTPTKPKVKVKPKLLCKRLEVFMIP